MLDDPPYREKIRLGIIDGSVTAKFIGQVERAESNSSVAALALVAEAMGCDLADLFQADTHAPYAYVSLRADDMRRAQPVSAHAAIQLQDRLSRRVVVSAAGMSQPKRARRSIHWQRQPGSVDEALIYVERLLDECLNAGRH